MSDNNVVALATHPKFKTPEDREFDAFATACDLAGDPSKLKKVLQDIKTVEITYDWSGIHGLE